jgi:glucokinase
VTGAGAAGSGGAACVVAIDVGGTLLKGGVCDRHGAIVAGERRRTARDDGDALVDGIVAFARDLAEEGRRRFGADAVAGVGLAVPGLVDEARGVARRAVNLPWRDLALAEVAAERLGLPVALSHDVRAAAAAEAALGAGRDADDFLFVAIGTGIGGAIVAGGHPFLGAHGQAGELGHVVVEPDGPPCACGASGCLEAIASAAAIERAYAAAGGGGRSAREVAALTQAGDPLASEVWARAARALGAALAAAVALLDPALVVLGGGLAEAGAQLIDPVAAELGERSHLGPAPRVVAAELGADAGCRGAALLAWRFLESGHTWVSDPPAAARAPGAA